MPHSVPSEDLPPLERLQAIMHLLRAPGGCPWDAEQTHESLVKHGIEEAYEVAEAVLSGDRDAIVDELGDLLLQPVFHAEIASEAGRFDLDDVARAICEKLVRRHPHVFGDTVAEDAGSVLRQWEEIKDLEKSANGAGEDPGTEARDGKPAGRQSRIGKANEGIPALMAAHKLQNRASRFGFDWPSAEPVLGKIREEVDEVAEVLDGRPNEALAEEIGDLLFAVVNLARKSGFDSELLLRGANRKFVARFEQMEAILEDSEVDLEKASLEEMDRAWEKAKSLPSGKGKKTG